MTTNIRSWFVYKYLPWDGMPLSAIAVRAIGPDRTKTLDCLPSSVIHIVTVQAKSKSEAYRLGIQIGGF